MGGGSGPAQKQTTTTELPANVGYWLNQYLNTLGPFAMNQAQQLAPYSTPLLQQALGLGQQETFGVPSAYFPQAAQSGGVNPAGSAPATPPPQNPMLNPWANITGAM